MSVKLRKRKTCVGIVDWDRSKPFVVNPRGLLIHRVASVASVYHGNGSLSHVSVHYWCGNMCNIDKEIIHETLHDDPPKTRLLCEFCELKAASAKQKSADKLTGRHVHRGRLRAFQTCCSATN